MNLNPPPARDAWASPLFKACVRFYPPAFQAEFGSDMVETFRSKLSDMGGVGRRAFFLFRECVSAIFGGVKLRFHGMALMFRKREGAREPIGFKEARASRRWKDFLPDLGQDFRQALRALGRRPGATTSGVIALGLGIGLTTLMFCVIYGAAFRPLPVPGGNRIAHIEQLDSRRNEDGIKVRPLDLVDWQAQQSSFEELGGFYTGTVYLSGEDRPERFFGAFVTANTFDIIQLPPLTGRGFIAEDGRPGAPPVVIISHGVWASRFGGEADVVGRVIRVNGEVSTIVGIMPEGFGFPYWQDVWIPLRIDHLSLARGEGPGLDVFGRLRDGVSLEQASAEFVGISDRLAQAYPETNENLQALIEGYTRSYLGPAAMPGFVAMFLTVFGVLLIACFNVANLLLALAVTRIRDMAIRVAVGASRQRVMAKVLQEAFLMAAIGAVLGTGLALAGIEIINRFTLATATYPPPFWMIIKVDAPILLFVVGVTGICALASGVLPALKASKTDVNSLLQENSRAGTSIRMGRMSRLMVMAEITVSATLLVVSGHLAWDVVRTQQAQYGYPVDDVLTARVGLFEELVPTQEARLGFFEQLQGRIREQPGVVSVAMATSLPGTEVGRYGFSIQGEEMDEGQSLPRARTVRVSPGFFEALAVPVTQGREFTWEDNVDAELVAVVNQSFLERFFPETSPLGRQVRWGGADSDSPWLTVVGVVPDMNMDGAIHPKGNPEGIYRPIAQGDVAFVSVAVRTRGDPLAFAPTLRDEVSALQGDTPIFYVQTLRDAINIGFLDFILLGGLFAAFAVAAFFMAAVGLYSVTAFLASQRTRELGLRMALGAGAGSILGLVLRKGVYQVAFGISLGVVFAALGRVMMESGGGWVTEWNMTIAVLVSITLGITGLLAVVTPALRATRVNPVDALRME